MDEAIRAELEQEIQSDFHKQLLDHCRDLVSMSRRHMQQFYPRWDANNNTYRAQLDKTRQDEEAESRDEPTKQVIPVTYAQVQTFVSFCMTLYLQRQHVFEVLATGEEDYAKASVAEALLDRDLAYNKFDLCLYQFLLNVARYGVGIIKHTWWEETKMEEVEVPATQATMFGVPITPDVAAPPIVIKQRKVVFQGNKLSTPSPYRFFPDPRIPFSRLQEGEFVASEEWFTKDTLTQWERNGSVAGVKHIKPLAGDDLKERLKHSRVGNTLLDEQAAVMNVGGTKTSRYYVVTECQVSLVPNEFKLDDGSTLGPEDYPIKYNVWYVNDSRVIKCEPMDYAHDQFTYSVGEYSADQEDLVSPGLCESIGQLQAAIDWFFNSHVASVAQVIGDKVIVDPSVVNWDDVAERKPAVRVLPQAAGTDVTKGYQQLRVQDVTGAHMGDLQTLHGVVQVVTGINDNALGQFHTGRRSAEEARTVNSATAARLKCLALIIFRSALEPMARQMLSNFQQGLTEETYVRVVGDLADPNVYTQFKAVTKADLQGRFDFGIFDGTLPSERGTQAMALQEILSAAFQNPQAVMMMGYDPKKIFEEWLTLRGIRHPKRLEMNVIRQQEIMLQMQQAGLVAPPQNANPNPVTAQAAGNAPAFAGIPNVAGV